MVVLVARLSCSGLLLFGCLYLCVCAVYTAHNPSFDFPSVFSSFEFVSVRYNSNTHQIRVNTIPSLSKMVIVRHSAMFIAFVKPESFGSSVIESPNSHWLLA